MRAKEVIELYRDLDKFGITIWIDGGWAVDAVVGHQTRCHEDLDIAVEVKAGSALRQHLMHCGYEEIQAQDASEWNFVMADQQGRKIDVHLVSLDRMDGGHGAPRVGIAYPEGSLTGRGSIAGYPVRCVRADYLLQFKTSYPPRPIDRADVAALCVLLNKPIPDTHR
jgi:lincosamide nucleotidyltransferase A/C/D/E